MLSSRIRLNQTHELNHIIDCVLNDPTGPYHQAILALITPNNVYRFAERVRRRSTRLIRCKQKNGKNLLAIRDALIMSLYAETAPPGWVNAWCDGSSVTHNNERRAGVGVVIFSQHWDCIAQISRAEGNKTAFEAEIKAVAFTLDTAVAHNITRIRVHTDNKALAHLWRQHRRDARLAEIRKRAANFMKLQICAIPRLHNQAANRLAKQAASSR